VGVAEVVADPSPSPQAVITTTITVTAVRKNQAGDDR
jgi:hypothetical protein